MDQSQSKQESSTNTKKLNLRNHASKSFLIENDSLNYWAWIQSAGFFHYHPETGFSGQNGEIWIKGNQKSQRIANEILLQNDIIASDTISKNQSETKDKNKITDQSQTSKSRNTIWWVIVASGLILIMGFRFWKRIFAGF